MRQLAAVDETHGSASSRSPHLTYRPWPPTQREALPAGCTLRDACHGACTSFVAVFTVAGTGLTACGWFAGLARSCRFPHRHVPYPPSSIVIAYERTVGLAIGRRCRAVSSSRRRAARRRRRIGTRNGRLLRLAQRRGDDPSLGASQVRARLHDPAARAAEQLAAAPPRVGGAADVAHLPLQFGEELRRHEILEVVLGRGGRRRVTTGVVGHRVGVEEGAKMRHGGGCRKHAPKARAESTQGTADRSAVPCVPPCPSLPARAARQIASRRATGIAMRQQDSRRASSQLAQSGGTGAWRRRSVPFSKQSQPAL
jgi:hypothetical protein